MNWTLHVTTILDQLSNVKTIHRRVKISAWGITMPQTEVTLHCAMESQFEALIDALIVFPWDNILWKVTYHIFYDCGVWKWITCVCGPKKHSSGQQSLVTRLSIELWHLVQRWRHFQPARKLDTKKYLTMTKGWSAYLCTPRAWSSVNLQKFPVCPLLDLSSRDPN